MLMSVLGQANASSYVSHTPCAHQTPQCRLGGADGAHAAGHCSHVPQAVPCCFYSLKVP